MQSNDATYVARDKYGIYKDRSTTEHALMGVDTLLGNDVFNLADEKVGTIKEFMIDVKSGKVSYAVLSFGGFLNVGDRLFAVPWHSLRVDTEKHRFMLDVSLEKLKAAPGFDKNHWPTLEDAEWATHLSDFYNEGPSSTGLRM